MFKFLHAADIHLDSPLRGLNRYESAPVEAIRNACRRAFENLVELAIAERVAFVLIAGDLYDGDWKDYGTGLYFSRQMGRLARHGIRVFAVAGNHDAASRTTKALEPPANVKMFSAKKPETVILEELGVAVSGRSFATAHVDENLAAGFEPALKGYFNIGLLHTSLDGREGHAPYAPCSLDDLRSRGHRYWALGHVHRQEVVSEHPHVVFPGCIQGRHVRETGPKGCVLVSVDDGEITGLEPVALDVFRWSQAEVELADAQDLREVHARVQEVLNRELAAADGRPLALRLHLRGVTPLADELAARPEVLEHGLRSLAAELAGDALWLEHVENHTTRRVGLDAGGLDAALAEDSPLAGLILEIAALPGTLDGISGLGELFGDLLEKLPAEALDSGTGLDLRDPATCARLVEEAKHLLIGRLLSSGGAK